MFSLATKELKPIMKTLKQQDHIGYIHSNEISKNNNIFH